ncbi:hypothetical protein TNCV_2187251 [Trichonephila clavipes]|nr:hypothetical protein TNCV_2187251 [Trichonephila clavipes]
MGGTLNSPSSRKFSWEIGGRGREMEGAPAPPPGNSLSKLGLTDQNRTVTYECLGRSKSASRRNKEKFQQLTDLNWGIIGLRRRIFLSRKGARVQRNSSTVRKNLEADGTGDHQNTRKTGSERLKVMSHRKQRSAFDQVFEFDRGRIVAYRYYGLSFRKLVVVLDETKQLQCRICDRWMRESTMNRRG